MSARRLVVVVAAAVAASLGAPQPAGAAAHPNGALSNVSAVPSTYHPIEPTRVLDTRAAASGGPIGPGTTLDVQMPQSTFTGSPSAVVLNVTLTQPAAGGHLIVYDASAPQPSTSNINFSRGQTIANVVTTRVGDDRTVAIRNASAGTVHVVVDLSGYFTPDQTGSAFFPSTPSRVVDTRNGTGLAKAAVVAPHTAVVWSLPNTVPASATAVVLNVTAVTPSWHGYLVVYPGNAHPQTSNVNFPPRRTVANQVIAPVDATRRITFYNESSGTVHIVADLFGSYVPDASGSFFYAVPAQRAVDTRTGTGISAARAVSPGGRLDVLLSPPAVGSGATAAALNVTVVQPSRGGHLSVFPSMASGARTSNINFGPGQTIANHVVVRLGRLDTNSNTFDVSFLNSSAGSIQLVVDVAGWLQPGFITALTTSSAATGQQDVRAVSCPDAGHCLAVGNYLDGDATAAGFIADQGSGWSTTDGALPADAATNPRAQYHDITCVGTNWCVAVKTYRTQTGHRRAAADVLGTGAPASPALPLPTGATDASAPSVSCGAQASCVAAGEYTDAGGTHALVERLASGSWTALAAPLPGDADATGASSLAQVSCPAADFCVAVGRYTAGAKGVGLIETFSAGTWTPIPAPYPHAAGDVWLAAVDCVSSTYCVARGYTLVDEGNDKFEAGRFTEILAGGAWTTTTDVVSGLPSGTAGGVPTGAALTCPAAGSCMYAVDERTTDPADEENLDVAERLQNGTWNRVDYQIPPDFAPSSPRNDGPFVTIEGRSSASCASTTSCAFVGSYDSSFGGFQPFIVRQTPGAWNLYQVPEPLDSQNAADGSLNGVSCAAPGSCVGVGSYRAADGTLHALIDVMASPVLPTVRPARGR